MKILVTGHLGYVGMVLVPMLREAGHAVFGYDSHIYRGSSFGNDSAEFLIPAVYKDIRDAVINDVVGYDAIIHLAGLSNDPLGFLNPSLTNEINYEASVKLARLAKQAGVPRFIFSSSCSNYGAGVDDWLDENSAFNPVTPYGRSKVQVEQAVAPMADDDFSPTFLRSGTAYGVSSRLRFDLVLNNLTAWAYTTGLVRLKSDGTPWRPIVHIEDMARAFKAVAEAPRDLIHNEAFNVGRTSENYQVREMAQIVVDTVPNSVLEFAPDAGPDKRNYRVNCDKLPTTLTSYKPVWTARAGVEELFNAYREANLQPDEFEGARYRRVHHVRHLLKTGALDDTLRWRSNSMQPSTAQLTERQGSLALTG